MVETSNAVAQEQVYQTSPAPVRQLNAKRSLLKFILLGIITLGIYPIVFYSGISADINVIAGRYDGRKTMHFCLLCFLVGPITLGIACLVWFHRISERIGDELNRRNIDYSFGAKDFWLWFVLGAFIIVGPFVYVHKLATASNKLAEHYNING
ncbi:MAG: DUF4234 domain-containing protein [Clostridiales bacterium]|jgi:hypothetical protein|nr:DUF4234 domain-containing protein [Clostridiales bacterium]